MPPENEINIVQVPQLQFDRLLMPVLDDFDEQHQFKGSIFRLIDQLKTEQAFNRLNDFFHDQIRRRKLREEYLKRKPAIEEMTGVTRMIVENILKHKLMYRPVIEYRVKDFNSFWEKIKEKEQNEKGIKNPFERCTDLAGIRIIFYNTIDMRKAIRLIRLSGDFVAAIGKSLPVAENRTREYGYRAYHMDVRLNPVKRIRLPEYAGLQNNVCEIQFTTMLAHSWNKVHHAIAYKDNTKSIRKQISNNRMTAEFRIVAEKLKPIEEMINLLCRKYYKKRKTKK